MLDILIILLCIALGMSLGYVFRKKPELLKLADKASLYAVYILLFILGAGLGADSELFAQLPRLGGTALVIALCCTFTSALCLMPVRSFFPGRGEARAALAEPAAGSPFMGSIRILCCFALGVALGFLSLTPAWLQGGPLATYALFLLVFMVGIGLGADIRAFSVIRDMRLKILAVPLLIVLGSALGAIGASLLLPGLNAKDALCVGAGLGYYSLSSIIIESSGNSALASVALLANILREVLAIVAAPALARFCGRLTTVGAAGATAMDTGLPVIARFSGERVAVVAVFSGMTLTLLVPFLVAAALRL